MSEGEQCGSCRFWFDQGVEVKQGRIGRCRRRAPYSTSARNGEKFPTALSPEWCGEFEGKDSRSDAMGELPGSPARRNMNARFAADIARVFKSWGIKDGYDPEANSPRLMGNGVSICPHTELGEFFEDPDVFLEQHKRNLRPNHERTNDPPEQHNDRGF